MMKLLTPLILGASDLYIKERIDTEYEASERVPSLIPGVVYRKLHNPGFSMGRLKNKPEAVRALSVAAAAFAGTRWFFTLFRKGRQLEKLGWALSFAGALSNTLDRLRKGYVVDYIQFKKGPKKLQKIIFNLADVMIALGAILTFLGVVARRIRGK